MSSTTEEGGIGATEVNGGVEVDTAVEVTEEVVAAEVIEAGAEGDVVLGARTVVVSEEVIEAWKTDGTEVRGEEVTGVDSADGGTVFGVDLTGAEVLADVGAVTGEGEGLLIVDIVAVSVVSDEAAADVASVNIAPTGRSVRDSMDVEESRGERSESRSMEAWPDPVELVSEDIPACVTGTTRPPCY